MPSPIPSPKKHMLAGKKVDTNPPVAISTEPGEYAATDTSNWLTRNEASDLIACSPATLLNYERRGVLLPQHVYRADNRGVQQRVVVYDPNEITRLGIRLRRGSARGGPREPGELAALATELFDEEKTNAEVVVVLRITFEIADELRQKWIDATEARLVISPIAKEALERIVGPFTRIADLIDSVAKLKPAA